MAANFSDCEILSRFPLQVPPRRPLLAWSRMDEETGAMAMYREDGSRWFVMDANLRTIPVPHYGPTEPYCRQAHKMADADQTIAKCYFIGGDQGAIKIGYSVDVKSRLMSLQSGSPIPLRVLATAKGGQARESAYHQQFVQYRLHGEWFDRHPDILAEIERLSGDSPNG